ncbi:right-handed parallel beta-helix repeat-containing protein [Klebsiella pneumoniae]|uniref:hypothetical protein n=2 Tax=Klebsiella pneumoniae TaxID=573 RepID=UPI002543E18C|nr:hypothetical protein [Klebsiella pneumoniae]WII46394.1 right-handed parallel beta-helix repeat-containing protein [Klebsiella pneumoniae]
MAITDTQQSAQFAASAAVSAAEAKQYALSIEKPIIDIAESVSEAKDAAVVAGLARDEAKDIASGLSASIDFELAAKEAEFESQMQGQRTAFEVSQQDKESDFLSSQSQREADFVESQTDRENRFQTFLDSSGYVFLGDYENGPFQFSARNQYIRYNNQYYRLNAATNVGFTTTGTDATTFANDVTHFVLMDGDTLRQDLGSSDGTKLIVAPGNGGTLHDWINGQLRSLFYYLSPAKIASVIGGVATDITAELQAAMNDNRPVWLPAGQYYVTASIAAAANSSLTGPGPRLASIDNRSSSHLFIIGAGGYLRGCKLWKGFSITASGNNTADAYAFYYSDRQDANGAPVYTIGQIFSEIEINAYGKLGGGWYLQECFRVVISNCGATGLSQPFRLVGSVVQTTIDNFVQNGDGAAPMTGRTYTYGLTTEPKTYGNGTVFTPEGLTVVNTRFVKQDIGVRVAGGLFLVFDAVEADYSKYKGFWYDGGSQVSFDNCYVGVQSYRDGDFVGFDIPARAAGVAEAVNVRGCTVNMSENTHESASSYKSLGVRVGDSSVGQKGALIDGCTFRGDGYDAGIYVYRGSSVSINNNRFQYSGVNISVAECTNLVMIGNSGNGAGKYLLNSSSPVATWTLLNNTESFESVTNINPGGLVAKNPGYNSATLRRIERVSSPVNVSVAAGATYQHAAPATIPLAASVAVGGAIPVGLLFSAAPGSTSLIRATFFNPTSATITLSTTLYFDITHPN